MLEEHGAALDAEEQQTLDALQAAGKTIMLVGDGGGDDTTPEARQALGLIAVADRIRPTARDAIQRLQAQGILVALLTGDNRRTAEAVAGELGIQRVFAEVLPAQKAQYVKELQAEGYFTAMVGDGVNDAPALAQANLGIAIGAGTGVAIETADVVLMRSDPLDVLAAMRLSQATVRKMKQNLFWAAIYNVIAIPIAGGILALVYGGFTYTKETQEAKIGPKCTHDTLEFSDLRYVRRGVRRLYLHGQPRRLESEVSTSRKDVDATVGSGRRATRNKTLSAEDRLDEFF